MHALKIQLALVTLACSAAAAVASPYPTPAFTSLGAWETSLNGVDNWVPAVAVSNPYTVPVAVRNAPGGSGVVLERTGPLGQFMWHPDVAGVRPVEVWFRLNFTYDQLGSDSIGAWFAADDYAQMTLNGVPLITFLLDSSMDAYGQPIPGFVDVGRSTGLKTKSDPWGDGIGFNTMMIHAQDGDASSAYNRGLAWVLVDGDNIGQMFNGQVFSPYLRSFAMVSPGSLPEPSGAVLVLAALMAMGLARRLR